MYRHIKSFVDRLFAFVLLVAFSPIIAIISVLILLMSGKPVFFIQDRVGFKNRIFRVYKFRTMTVQTTTKIDTSRDMERLTSIGKYIRKLSLDELPQLFNVLKGEMSFIGPRPLLVEYLPLYSEEQKLRHLVKPGITGLAQVNGRNALSWERKFKYDTFYVDHISLWEDIKILALTVVCVLFSRGVNSAKGMTMEKFKGSE